MAIGDVEAAKQPSLVAAEPAVFGNAPIRPSWVNAVIARVDRAPAPDWLVYAVMTGIAVVFANAQAWTSGRLPVGQFDLVHTFYGVVTIAPLWLIHGLNRVARSALDEFRSASALDDAALATEREALTVIPWWPAIVLTMAGVLLALAGYLADPTVVRLEGLSPVGLAVRIVAESLIVALVLILLYHSARQLRAVSRIHAAVTKIDLLRPAPLYAFSRLTASIAIGIVLVLYVALPADPEAWPAATQNVLLFIPWLVLPVVVSVAAFVLPLRGMHASIATEKGRLMDACARRIEEVTRRIHAAVDADDLSQADGLNKMLASLVMERDMLTKLPTWPWQSSTIGAFGTAIVLPVVLLLLTRLMDDVI